MEISLKPKRPFASLRSWQRDGVNMARLFPRVSLLTKPGGVGTPPFAIRLLFSCILFFATGELAPRLFFFILMWCARDVVDVTYI